MKRREILGVAAGAVVTALAIQPITAATAIMRRPEKDKTVNSQVSNIAILTAKPGKEAELESLLRGMVRPSRAEPGNLRWDIWRVQDQPAQFVLNELYKDDAGLAAHRATPHFQNYLSKIGDLASRTAIVSHPVDVA